MLMKKLLKLITSLAAILVILTACSSEKTKVYTQKFNDNQEAETTITYTGNRVDKISYESTIKNLGTDEELALNSLKESYDNQYKDVQGYEYSVEKKDGKILLKGSLDFNKINFEKDKDKLNMKSSSLDEERNLSNVEKRLTDGGATEKK